MIEIEIKAALNEMPLSEVVKSAQQLGFKADYSCTESDIYYNGNDRNFAKTDEALRIRTHTENGVTETLITYKGPKQSNGISNTRTELETAVRDADTMLAILSSLGYKKVLAVNKTRRGYKMNDINLCLDTVEGLGDFIELETIVPDNAGESVRTMALEGLMSLLDSLSVPRSSLTQTTYLEMLMKKAR